MRKILAFFRNESGIETLEYAVIGAIVITVAALIYGAGWGSSIKTSLLEAASQTTGVIST